MNKTGIATTSYKYNDGGIRTQKTVDGAVTDYYLSGDKVLYETRKNTGGTITDTLYYTYDEKGDVVSFNLKNSTYPNGADFYYVRNGQNDIIGLLDNAGTQVVTYTYDTWGKLISTNGTLASSVGTKNSYLYRGYRYDSETMLYYLNSRYYNPEIGRFINADGLVSTGQGLNSCNMFAYCLNNPVNLYDPSGHCALCIEIKNAIMGITANTMGYTIADLTELKNFHLNAGVAGINPQQQPPSDTGFKPPKNPDKGKQRVPAPGARGEKGWLDKDGDVWVPDIDMDGGEGWRVHYPNGSHGHVYPGGHVREHNFSSDVDMFIVLGVFFIAYQPVRTANDIKDFLTWDKASSNGNPNTGERQFWEIF